MNYWFNANETVGNWAGFSLDWYAKVWANDVVQKTPALTFQIAAVAAVQSSIIVTMAASGTTRRATQQKVR